MMSTSNPSNPSGADWLCSNKKCGNMNFARRKECNRCGKPQESEGLKKHMLGTEIGKVAAEKSHGLFSAEDWQCNKCGNVNWARRGTCNMCNAPKVGEVEERTGYGGGFNERAGVEYITREESDDEFDEFGRRKKKFRGKNHAKDERKTENDHQQVEQNEEEEEEDDDDDDEDLSKYALWSDDEDDQNKTSTNTQSSSSQSAGGNSSQSNKLPINGSARSRSPRPHTSRDDDRRSRRSRSRSRSSGRDYSHYKSRNGSKSSRRSRSRSPVRGYTRY